MLKKLSGPAVFLFCLCLCAAARAATPAQPTTALFFPDEVQVTVEERLKAETLPGGGKGVLIAIPAQADQSTFSVTVGGMPAGGVYWLELPEDAADEMGGGKVLLPEREKDPRRKELLTAVAGLKEEAAQRQGALQAIAGRIKLWQIQPSKEKPPTPDELLKLDEALGRLVPGLYADQEKEQRALADIKTRLALAEKNLRDHDAANAHHIAAVPFDGNGAESSPLRYSYIMPASCRTSYRLVAAPAKDSLSIEQDAFLFQNSGFAWTDAEIFISTTGRDKSVQPAPIWPWVLSFEKPRVFDNRKMAEAPAPAPMMQRAMSEVSLDKSAPIRPVQEEKSSFRLWSLGKRRIENNAPARVPLSSESYKTRYRYTLRPASNPKGFLTAELSLPQALELPAGNAQFFVDNVLVGEEPFSFNGDKGILFFGTDPQITATMRDLKRTTGEQGFISKEQTVLWHWQITLKNTRNRPVDLVVEDPAPNAADTAITLSVESTPKPEEAVNAPQLGGAKIYRWKLSLKPGETQIIDHKVQASAPADKQLQPGRGMR